MGENIIELNGKRYDAITGAYLGKSNVVPKNIAEQYVRGKVIDGFVRRRNPAPGGQVRNVPSQPRAERSAPAQPRLGKISEKPTGDKLTSKTTETATKANLKPSSISQPAKAASAQKTAKRAEPLPARAKHKRTERSKTLMRRATKKPEFSIKPAIRTQTPAELMAKPASEIARKASVYSVSSTRQQRAFSTAKHRAVSRFGIPAAAPATNFAPPALAAVDASTSPAIRPAGQIPIIAVRPAPPKPLTATRPASRANQKPNPSKVFEKALSEATSHLQPAHKARKKRSKARKVANAFAVAAAFLVIIGFVGYLNLPQLQLQFASVQAGFGASIPSHTPTGYAMDKGIQRSGGTITLSFRSGESHFSIKQQASNWNSQTLLDDTLALSGQHKTVQKNGQIIYIFEEGEEGETRAAWVNGGVRYTLSGNAHLSPEEIADIATSM